MPPPRHRCVLPWLLLAHLAGASGLAPVLQAHGTAVFRTYENEPCSAVRSKRVAFVSSFDSDDVRVVVTVNSNANLTMADNDAASTHSNVACASGSFVATTRVVDKDGFILDLYQQNSCADEQVSRQWATSSTQEGQEGRGAKHETNLQRPDIE